ncbi:MAG: hypothetical protein V1916_00070 [Patescibacteria group bacterium]
MVPDVQLMYNYEYASRLYRGTGIFEDVWRSTIGLGTNFEKVFDEFLPLILEAIPRFTGVSWDGYAEPNFPVYLAPVETSFPHPLTLAVGEDPEAMLDDLIVQLAHRNMYFGFPSDEVRDQSLRQVADHVLADLRVRPLSNPAWDLRSQTVRARLHRPS